MTAEAVEFLIRTAGHVFRERGDSDGVELRCEYLVVIGERI
jgi:hypothetical protein